MGRLRTLDSFGADEVLSFSTGSSRLIMEVATGNSRATGRRKVSANGKRKNIHRKGPIQAAGENTAGKGSAKNKTAPAEKEKKGPEPEVDKEKNAEPAVNQDGDIFVIIENTADIDGGANHWALFFQSQNTDVGVISEAVGISGQFVYRPRFNIRPESSTRFAQRIPVGWTWSYGHYIMALQFTPIRNDIAGWNCQNFVMEGLQQLHGDGCIGFADLRKAITTLRPLMDSHAVRYCTPESD